MSATTTRRPAAVRSDSPRIPDPEAIRRSQLDLYGAPEQVFDRVRTAVAGTLPAPTDPIPDALRGALYVHQTDTRLVAVYPLLPGTVRVVCGQAGDLVGYEDAFCYAEPHAGLLAAACWDGVGDPPDGWFRHVRSGRRRPGGDPALQYISA